MNRFKWVTLSVLLAGLATATGVIAQGPGGGQDGRRPGAERGFGGPGRGGGAGGFGFGVRDLDLSEAQRQQIGAVVAKAREDTRPQVERLRQATEARRKALAVMPVDENQIRSTTQALTVAQTDLAIARARVQSDIFALLTPDQQTKVTEARQRRESRMAERRSRTETRRQQRQQQPNAN
jgi:Spy/CpxP family protein refolding chaperone